MEVRQLNTLIRAAQFQIRLQRDRVIALQQRIEEFVDRKSVV